MNSALILEKNNDKYKILFAYGERVFDLEEKNHKNESGLSLYEIII